MSDIWANFSGLAFTCTGTALFLGLVIKVQRKRTQVAEESVEELRPNCLLTRYPIIFLEGPSSLLYRGHHWNQIPEFLAAHGYEVHQVHGGQLAEWLTASESKNFEHHLFVDSSALPAIESLLSGRFFSCLRSLTVTGAEEQKSHTTTLRPLRNSCEELQTNQQTLQSDPLWSRVHWQLHRLLQPQAVKNPRALGWTPRASARDLLHHLFLNRSIELAERDLTALNSQPPARTNHHDPSASRPARDSEFAPHLSTTPSP